MATLDPIIREDVNNIISAIGLKFKVLAGKTILVTGANGFLASYFIDTICQLNETILSKSPVKVIAVTRRPVKKKKRRVFSSQTG